MGYDIIGDIHGHNEKLEALLYKLGYRNTAGAWRHPERQAIFVGDFIDRGPSQVQTVNTVRRMVEAGVALAVMGNHELNAIAWHTPDPRKPGRVPAPAPQCKMGREEPETARSLPGGSGGQASAARRNHRLVPDSSPLVGPTRPAGSTCLLARTVHGVALAPTARGPLPDSGPDGAGDRRTGE